MSPRSGSSRSTSSKRDVAAFSSDALADALLEEDDDDEAALEMRKSAPQQSDLRPGENPLLSSFNDSGIESPSPMVVERPLRVSMKGEQALTPISSSKRGSIILKKRAGTKGSTNKFNSSLYSKKQIQAALKIQRFYRLRRLLSLIETGLVCNKRRRAILREMHSTEESYVASLRVLQMQFMERLKDFFSETELLNMFCGVKELIALHTEFYSKLRSQVPGVSKDGVDAVSTLVASLFVAFAPQFEDVYTLFLTHQDRSRRMMEAACGKDKELVKEMDKIVDANGSQRGRQFFDSLMTGPMQRLPRYQLLLREYQKHTNFMYPDVKDINAALQAVANVTLIVNENKRDHDELHMREMLEQNSSMEVLETHTFEEMTFSAARSCAECDKAIWGLSKSGFRCSECSSSFHNQCMKQVANQRLCPRRKKLDFSLKKLTYLHEVFVIPFTPDLHVATPSMSMSPPNSGLNLLSTATAPLVSSLKESSSNTPTMRRAGKKHRSKAVLCFFDDGLGIAHIRSDEMGADKFDFMGDLPWAILDEGFVVEEKEQEDEWILAVKARFQEWHFALPTKTEQEALVRKLNEARKAGSGRRRASSIAGAQKIRK